MKKCVIISDSFKGTLTSLDICNLARQSIPRFFPSCEIVTIPVADGGEGTVSCFVNALQAVPIKVNVTGPYGESIQAVYAKKGSKAIVEMSCAAGLPMAGSQRNPAKTTTYGVGQVILHAVQDGCTEILLGLGGSATNDGGCGCAAALGVKFYDPAGELFIPRGETLDQICHIDISEAQKQLEQTKITAMCDVDNPLCGPNGAAYIFAPQKGADEALVRKLDYQLSCLDKVIRQELGVSIALLPGAGAAGGMGAGCVAFLGAELKSGIEAILDMVNFDRILEDTELVITGEGRIDFQSIHGKVISGIAKRTRIRNIPLIAIVGAIHDSAATAYDLGVTAMFGIDREAVSFQECAHKTCENYQKTLEDILRLIRAVKSFRV